MTKNKKSTVASELLDMKARISSSLDKEGSVKTMRNVCCVYFVISTNEHTVVHVCCSFSRAYAICLPHCHSTDT